MNFLIFYLPGKVFIFPEFMKDNLAKQIILGWQIFLSFSILTLSFHFLLACKISAQKSSHSLWGFHCMRQISLADFKILFDFWQFFCDVLWWIPLWVESVWGPVSFMHLNIHICPQIWGVFRHYFLMLSVSFFSFWDSHNANNVSLHGILWFTKVFSFLNSFSLSFPLPTE